MEREDTGITTTQDRFYDFVTKDFPDFRVDMGERMTGFETHIIGINGRLKKIEKKIEMPNSNSIKTGLFKFLPWLITAVVVGAALGGAALAGGI